MKGIYTIHTADGPVTYENIITDNGKSMILGYLADNVAFWGDEIAVGVSGAVPAATDESLGFEVARARVSVAESDVATNSVTLKAAIAREVVGDFHEIGLFSTEENAPATSTAAPLSDFDTTYMETTNLTADATNSRIGESGALLSAGAGVTSIGSIDNLHMSLEGRPGSDILTLAYYNSTSAATNLEVRFYTSETGYFSYSFVPAVGYSFHSWTKDSFTANGGDWISNVIRIEFHLTAGTATASVTLDGMRVGTIDSGPLYGLVSRSTVTTPIVKEFGVELEIEYTIQFGW